MQQRQSVRQSRESQEVEDILTSVAHMTSTAITPISDRFSSRPKTAVISAAASGANVQRIWPQKLLVELSPYQKVNLTSRSIWV